MALADLRREYALAGLRRQDLDPDPVSQFNKWFQQATGSRASGRLREFLIRCYKRLVLVTGAEPMDMNAMTLATVDKQGRPSARIVLLKGLDERGFVFYTNYESRKGRELSENPSAALVFYWPGQERQVCVAGSVTKVSVEESKAYFTSRPRGSRVGAWASKQSSVVADRRELESRWAEYESRFAGQEVPLPPFWGGFLLRPERYEFWQGRPNRLHDRFQYSIGHGNTWLIERLSP